MLGAGSAAKSVAWVNNNSKMLEEVGFFDDFGTELDRFKDEYEDDLHRAGHAAIHVAGHAHYVHVRNRLAGRDPKAAAELGLTDFLAHLRHWFDEVGYKAYETAPAVAKAV